MLLPENYTAEHIARLREKTGADPSILERTVFAFGLLEAIRMVDMPFVFKGGTSLLVILDEPRRLSTDIDIIVDRDVDVDGYIEKAGKLFPFVGVEEHKRKGDWKPFRSREMRSVRLYIMRLFTTAICTEHRFRSGSKMRR